MPEFFAEAGMCLVSLGQQAEEGDYEVVIWPGSYGRAAAAVWWWEEGEVAPCTGSLQPAPAGQRVLDVPSTGSSHCAGEQQEDERLWRCPCSGCPR